MGEQLVISISREFGSGGHEIAAKLAERLDLVFYDRSMLDEIAAGMNADAAELHKYDESQLTVCYQEELAIILILMKRLLHNSSLIISVRKRRVESPLW